jgi:hypothetical protein
VLEGAVAVEGVNATAGELAATLGTHQHLGARGLLDTNRGHQEQQAGAEN